MAWGRHFDTVTDTAVCPSSMMEIQFDPFLSKGSFSISGQTTTVFGNLIPIHCCFNVQIPQLWDIVKDRKSALLWTSIICANTLIEPGRMENFNRHTILAVRFPRSFFHQPNNWDERDVCILLHPF